jgi:hypothetical protein
METTTARQCQARNKRGEPCNAQIGTGSDYCFHHDPAKAAERKAARSKGGFARHGRKLGKNVRTFDEMRPPTQIRTVDDVMTLLEKGVHDLFSLENSVSRARALGTLAMAALKALEVGEYETRLAALEKSSNGKNT